MSTITETTDSIGMRDRLLDAAEQVVAHGGVSNLTLEAVARQARVSKGGLLYHFPSKSALITGVVERISSRCEMRQQAAMETDPNSPGGFTRAYITARARPIEPHEQPIKTALLAAVGTDPQYLEPMRRRFSEWQSKIEDDGIDPATATIVRLAIDGLCLGTLLGMSVPTGDFRQQILDRLTAMTNSSTKGS